MKRKPTSTLTRDNWDDEEEPEEQGTAKLASDDALKNRPIKVAKRRLQGSEEEGKKGSLFSTFSGFARPAPKAGENPFGFLSKVSGPPGSSKDLKAGPSNLVEKSKTETSNTKSKDGKGMDELDCKVMALNVKFVTTVVDTVTENPLCILTPVCDSYNKYVKEFKRLLNEREKQKTEPAHNTEASESKESSPSFTTFKFGAQAGVPSEHSKNLIDKDSQSTKADEKAKPLFSFAARSEQVVESKEGSEKKSLFAFGSNNDIKGSVGGFTAVQNMAKGNESSSGLFQFGAANNLSDKGNEGDGEKPKFSFFSPTSDTNLSKDSNKTFSPGYFNFKQPESDDTEDQEEKTDNGDTEEEKTESKPVTEEGSIFEKRCKVFFKKDGNYADRGIGILFLKVVDVGDAKKSQVIIRTDDALGKILVNVVLNESIPTQKVGKNNVMIVCCPQPGQEHETMLLKVKTAEDAQELLDILEKHKKAVSP